MDCDCGYNTSITTFNNRISYCSADATYDRVVAFIATNKNETLECHAFLTSKKKIAQAAALTISQAFTIDFEKWQNNKSDNKLKNGSSKNSGSFASMANGDDQKNEENSVKNANTNGTRNGKPSEPSLIDLSDESVHHQTQMTTSPFDEQLFETSHVVDQDLDDSFSKLAQSRKDSGPTNGTTGNDPWTNGSASLPPPPPTAPATNGSKSNGGNTNGRSPFVLPTNVPNIDFANLPSYFNFNATEEKNGKFFTDDSPDDLFSL